jgi:hypothetical protein
MHRTQVQLTDDQIAALRAIASAQNRSLAELVRESVDLYVKSSAKPNREEIVRRAKAIAGEFASGLSDVSTRHDHYLAESEL